ncbi:uncharacterized protein PHACADRAFT_181828 [Phanerochaete carnosa HHB-10118-sp]|uniref:Uncharacterized protein n=1 Tax=Phanerochaete carnosa (strain HHB-10118-sp) TaxID=650164 RepID=K5WL53_PHACS|nr:uncharacterized protein PHACADRAFT_181828 [Phanerochaete carnosa HHB-10118-sp]EKM59889.1 hypothetical protein PHACADRAFT_181828 [Phanerochaete carnosa HHB-10118-sp]
MTSQPMRRGHRKRISALRLSSDTTVTTLPVYTSPPWRRQVVLVDDPSDLPPEYPDSAEEADEDTDTEEDESQILYASHVHSAPLTAPPRRASHLQVLSRSKSRRSTSSDPYLDSLLARSVHALEMSNTLLQSSMSTRATLDNVLSRGSQDEASLEAQARNLSSRITRDNNWQADLDQISQGVAGLFDNEEGPSRRMASEDSISQSLPASSPLSTVAECMSRSHLRRPSLDMRNASLNLAAHHRNDLVAPPPRAMTMYVDSSEDPSSITLPSTLGLRSSHHAAAPLPAESSLASCRPLLLHAVGSESDLRKRSAIDILSSVASPPKAISSTTSSTASPSSSFRTKRSDSTSTTCTRKPRQSRSPRPKPLSISPLRSPSRDSTGRSPSSARRKWVAPPIIELPSTSSSESSDELHVERTVSYLRNILENHPSPASLEKQKQREAAKPSFLKPSPVAPVADASTATASVSRLFTKARHTSSTRPPSPPRHSALKGKSGRSAPPTPTSPTSSLSGSWLNVSDAIGIGGSGRSTPNRVSFIEPPEVKQGGKDKSSLRTRSRSRSKGKGKGKAGDGYSSDTPAGWWSWIIGPAPNSPTVPSYVRQEDRLVRGAGWAPRAGFGSGGMEEWGV